MKIQSLAVIFIIIILPISLVLSSYMQSQIKTINLQSSYDSKLKNATYDAVKAFQLNTISSSTSDIAKSKIRDIEASASTFINSVAANFGLTGDSKEAIQNYIPAIVYTLYDGYYIYSPYTNTIPTKALEDNKKIDEKSTYQPDEKIYGLKPYIYYSCRYKPNENSDFTITYSLDNYITIQGYVGTTYVNRSGYLIDIDKVTNIEENITSGYTSVQYRGVEITKENLKEFVAKEFQESTSAYICIKNNGVKNYYDETEQKWFSMLNGERVYNNNQYNKENYNAVDYYVSAYKFSKWLFGNSILKNLTYGDAVDAYERPFEIGDSEDTDDKNYTQNGGLVGNTKIFEKTNIEYPDSNFNQHRLAVIRNAIESNLSVAIANYNDYSDVKTNYFLMPSLQEDEWNLLLNNTCVISFLQGMSIGGKVYNGYSVVPNNKNKEVVTEDSIYICTSDHYYHRVGEARLSNSGNLTQAYLNIDFEPQITLLDNNIKGYYYPHQDLASYTSIITQTGIDPEYDKKNIYEYLADKSTLAKIYYTALGRERYGMYRSNYDVYISTFERLNEL